MEEIRQNLNEKAKDAKRVYKLRFGIIRLLINAFFFDKHTLKNAERKNSFKQAKKSPLHFFITIVFTTVVL